MQVAHYNDVTLARPLEQFVLATAFVLVAYKYAFLSVSKQMTNFRASIDKTTSAWALHLS